MEELIVKYLTDTLTSEEEARFRAMAASDAGFSAEFKRCLAALALADYSLSDAGENNLAQRKLAEFMRHI